MKTIKKDIVTIDRENIFRLRLDKDEGIGLLTTSSERNYLILDSIDYWYDLTQTKYPSEVKCNCRNNLFKVYFEYLIDDQENVKTISIFTKCNECEKEKLQTEINIDYAPTKILIEQPITYCEVPKVKYKYKDYLGYWNTEDRNKVLKFFESLGCKFYSSNWNNEKNQEEYFLTDIWKHAEEKNGISIFVSMNEIPLNGKQEKKHLFWRKKEAIYLRGPMDVRFEKNETYEIGHLYEAEFCTETINKENGKTEIKSKEFEKFTTQFELFLKDNFIKKGKQTFNSKSEEKRLFGES